MTDTIPNVPRELLERAWRALANSATGREIGAYLDADPCAPECAETCARASMCATCSADLSAPSPAGVDGLNTDRNAAFKACPESGCDWGSFYLGWKARGEVEQAIIDGLRGEVADLRTMLATVSKAGIRVRTERDQQAQRIGELEGLLLDTGAERNAMQRERDAYKLLLDRECNDADFIFMALGIAPDSIRTEGGFLMVAHLVSLISAKSEKLETLLHEAIPGLQHLSDTAQDIDTFTLVARVKSALSAGKDSDQ